MSARAEFSSQACIKRNGNNGTIIICNTFTISFLRECRPIRQDIGEWMGVSTVEAGREALERGEFRQAVWEATSIKDPP